MKRAKQPKSLKRIYCSNAVVDMAMGKNGTWNSPPHYGKKAATAIANSLKKGSRARKKTAMKIRSMRKTLGKKRTRDILLRKGMAIERRFNNGTLR